MNTNNGLFVFVCFFVLFVVCRDAWHKVAPDTFDRRAVKMLCVTWNCGESRPYPGSEFFRHIKEQALEKSLIVIGLQEVEMGRYGAIVAYLLLIFTTHSYLEHQLNTRTTPI